MKGAALNTLKDYAKYRLLDDMITTVKANAGNQLGYFILVCDRRAIKVLSSICKMYDLISYRISSTECLNLGRKRYPAADAIYLLEPSVESVDLVLKDFSDSKTPQYQWVHLFFLGPLPQSLFTKIAEAPLLVQRVKTLKELNLNFFIKEAELFHFGENPDLTICASKPKEERLNGMAEKLMTVCCTLLEQPYIQYDGKSALCQELAQQLQKKLAEVASKASGLKPHEPRGTVLIVDRRCDLNAPVLHDFCHGVMVHDLLQVRKDNALDPEHPTVPWPEELPREERKAEAKEEQKAESKEEQKADAKEEKKADSKSDPRKTGPTKKLLFLGDNDKLWTQFRYLHIGEVLERLSTATLDLAKSSPTKLDLKDQVVDLDKLQQIMSAMPSYREILESYSGHQKVASECVSLCQAREYINLAKLEQGLATGVEPNGEDLDTKKVAVAIGRLLSDFKSVTEEDMLRIYVLYLTNYDVPRRDFETLIKTFPNTEHKDILAKLSLLGVPKPSEDLRKPQRRAPKLRKDDFELYRQRSERTKFRDMMYLPRLARVVIDASKKELSTDEFPFVADRPPNYGKKKAVSAVGTGGLKGKPLVSVFNEDTEESEMWSLPRMVVFMIGGLSYQEILTLFKLQRSKHINCLLTMGSECILTPKDFLAALKRTTIQARESAPK